VSLKDSTKAQLAAFKKQQAQARALEAQRLAELAQRQAQEQAEREQFTRTVASTLGRVTPLPTRQRRAEVHKPKPPAVAAQRAADEAQALASSLSDELDVTTLLDTDDGLSYCRPGVGADVAPRLRRGQWAIQRQLDLHGLTRDDAREALAQFVRQAARDGLRCVRIVHGKGNGSPGKVPVLKHKVRAWLVQKTEVMAFAQASAADGGHGAVLVLLG
jgi:DNA-nicking Smr family endonuclease